MLSFSPTSLLDPLIYAAPGENILLSVQLEKSPRAYLSPFVQSSSLPMTPSFTIANQGFKPEMETMLNKYRILPYLKTRGLKCAPVGIKLSAIMTKTAAPDTLSAAILPVLQAIT